MQSCIGSIHGVIYRILIEYFLISTQTWYNKEHERKQKCAIYRYKEKMINIKTFIFELWNKYFNFYNFKVQIVDPNRSTFNLY